MENYLARVVKPTALDRRLAAGAPFATALDGEAKTEVAAFGVIWIDAPISRYVDALRDIENSGAAQLQHHQTHQRRAHTWHFDLLHLPREGVADLRRCRVGVVR